VIQLAVVEILLLLFQLGDYTMPGDTSSMGGSGIDGFFSRIEQIAGSVGRTYGNIRPIWTGSASTASGTSIQTQPTYQGTAPASAGNTPSTQTTATVAVEKPNYMPLIIGAGLVVGLIFLLK
jgi:hypothetical protein